jgi:outer membrane protein assembly factor BamB
MNTAHRLLLSPVFAAALTAGAADWPQWRGPAFNGTSPEKNLPAQWSKTENIAWATPLPGPSAGTPAIWGGRIFLPSTDLQLKSQLALCLDRKTGKVLWQKTVGGDYRSDRMSNSASPSPVTDGKLVVFFYGRGDLAAFDLAGKELWARNIEKEYGEFAFQWMFSSSPLLYEGKLYLQVLQRDVPVNGRGGKPSDIESFLLAMDPATGKNLWKQVRPNEAVAESKESFATPIPLVLNGRKELLVIGGDCLTGHDPATGKELWRWGTWNPQKIGHWRLVPSPVFGDGVILACAPKKDPIYAIKAGGSGHLGDAGLLWTSTDKAVSSDVPTPAFAEGDFFILGDGSRTLSRVEPKTGKVKWTTELPGRAKIESSPTVADGKIYYINFAGEVTVVSTSDGRIINTIPMGEPGDSNTRSSVIAAYGQLFIRTNGRLYCVGKAANAAALPGASPTASAR